MPYIKKTTRFALDKLIKQLAKLILKYAEDDIRLYRCGILNYTITRLIIEIYGVDIRYADCNEIAGVLSCVSTEYSRRVVAPYEDQKIEQEGDVYPPPSKKKQ